MRSIFIAALILTAPASAETRYGLKVLPLRGDEMTATAGSAIFSRERVLDVSAVQLLQDVPEAGLAKGALLEIYIQSNSKLVACPVDVGGDEKCLIDRKPVGDGFQFRNNTLGSKNTVLAETAGYVTGFYAQKPLTYDTFMEQLTYLGVNGSTLRLMYREFANDMARPAFSDEVTFNLSGKFPETIAYKDVVIDVLEVGNAGIRYVLKEAKGSVR